MMTRVAKKHELMSAMSPARALAEFWKGDERMCCLIHSLARD